MSRRQKILISLTCVVIGIMCIWIIYEAFFSQWGKKGWSEDVCVTLSQQGIKEVGQIGNETIYTYNMADVVKIHISSKELNLEEFIEQEWVTAEDLLYGDKKEKMIAGQSAETYMAENYKILHVDNIIAYSPINKDEEQLIHEINKFRLKRY